MCYHIKEADMDLKILDKSGQVRFSDSGKEIDTVFSGEFSEDDKIVISAPLCEFITRVQTL